jgi:hypothetical protein
MNCKAIFPVFKKVLCKYSLCPMKTSRAGTLHSAIEIPLEPCPNLVMFLETIERINQLLKDPANIPTAIASGLRIKQKSKIMHKVHSILHRRGSDAEQMDKVQKKIADFIEDNERWYPNLDFEKNLRPLYQLPPFAHTTYRLDAIAEAIQEKKERDQLLQALGKHLHDQSTMKNYRKDHSRMDVHFLSSDLQEVSAHKVFLSREFPTNLSHVADAETIGLFLDIEYKVEDPDKFKDDSFEKLLYLSQHFNYLRLTMKIVELFIERLTRPDPPVVTALPFILNIPHYLFCPKLFNLIARILPLNREVSRDFIQHLLEYENKKPGSPNFLFLLGYICYKQRNGQSRRQASHLFHLASIRGIPLGTFFLGKCFRDGIGVSKSTPLALSLFKEAAKQGVPRSWISLGHMYKKPENRVFPDEVRNDKIVDECYAEAKRLESIDIPTTLENCLKTLAIAK